MDTSTAAIIGLGEIGVSLAMALKAENAGLTVIGHDYERSSEKYAGAKQCVDKTEHNLFDAVRDADLVILAVPADQTKKTLELLGQDLRDGTVVLDFCVAKTEAAGWARQYMKQPNRFLGVWAGIGPACLGDPCAGNHSARADLFKDGVLFAAAETDTSEAAIQTAADLAKTLKMGCAFTEPLELEGIISAVYLLPALAAHGLFSCLSRRPGWTDGKNAAGKTFYSMTSPVGLRTDQEDPGMTFLCSRGQTVRLLDEYIAELTAYRDMLRDSDGSALQKILKENKDRKEQWEKDQRRSAAFPKGPSGDGDPRAADLIRQTFFGGFLRNKLTKDVSRRTGHDETDTP